jgi:membrane-associated phospholipid phosphatase
LWLLDLGWASWAGFSVLARGILLSTLLLLAANLLLYRRMRGGERAYELAFGVAVFTALGSGFTLLSYLALTLRAPLADAWLARIDAVLAFDWLAWHRFVRGHPLLNSLLLFAYRSLGPQMALTLFVLPLSGMAARNRAFLGTTGIALLLTVAVSALLPAESAWVWHQSPEPIAPGPWNDFVAMRDGSLRVLDLQGLRGLVTFPSFHVVMAVLLAWAARGTRLAFLSVVLNGLMIASTPTEGGHYLVDVLAGVAAAVAAIVAVQAVTRRRSVAPPAGRGTVPAAASSAAGPDQRPTRS